MHFDLKLKKQLVVFDTETRKVAVKFVLNYVSIISHFCGLSRGFCILIYKYQIFVQNMKKLQQMALENFTKWRQNI